MQTGARRGMHPSATFAPSPDGDLVVIYEGTNESTMLFYYSKIKIDKVTNPGTILSIEEHHFDISSFRWSS